MIQETQAKNLEPDWADDPAEVAKRRSKEVRRKHPRRDTKASHEAALTRACRRAGVTRAEGRYFLTFYIEELTDALMRGEVLRVPRLAAMAVVPHVASRSFGMRFCGDPALRLRIREEMNGASRESYKAFRAVCRSVACAGPSYRRRGTTARGLVDGDRRRAWGELMAEAGIGAFEPDDKSIKSLRYWRERFGRPDVDQ